VNNEGQAVGTSFDASDFPHPFIWQSGVMTNLNALISPNSPWLLLEALGNNDRGQIVGYGYRTEIGEGHAYLASQCNGNHPGINGCDYSLGQGPAAVTQQSFAARDVTSRTLPQSLLRQMSRYHFPGRAFGPRNRPIVPINSPRP